MHPAYSVILFTTASGAGYGLLIWLAAQALGREAQLTGSGSILAAFGIAFALIVAGLLSSTAHLGRPERAWRAFSQWRTSWLSREGVLALATFVPAGLFGLLSWAPDLAPSGGLSLAALATILLALATVWCTGMIYQSLPTIRAWNRPTVSPIYVALALAAGGVLYNLLHVANHGATTTTLALKAIILLAVAAFLKLEYWRGVDNADRRWTAESATGLGRFGKVRVLEQPHAQANYIMREMGYDVARKHAHRLRRMALLTAFLLPAGLIALAVVSGTALALIFCVLAVVLMAFGLLTERWLFFAEAQHVVTVYYGADAA
jgi:sulfite dehydrogenase (quinone) subunit SoeC